MRLLLTTENIIVHYCEGEIAFGQWEEADKLPNGTIVYKWKFEDADGKITGYAIDENAQSAYGNGDPVCTVVTVDSMPEDYDYGKYIYKDGAVVANPDYVEPPKSDQERIADLEAENTMLEECILAMSEVVYA